MPKVPLTATKDFTYMTRRLVAGDSFEARNAIEAKILTRVRKVAEAPAPKPVRKAETADAFSPDPGTVSETVITKPAAKKAPAKRKGRSKK